MNRTGDPPFDWERDVGEFGLTPEQAQQDAHDSGMTIREYADAYAAEWPYARPRPPDLVDGMVRAMLRAREGIDTPHEGGGGDG